MELIIHGRVLLMRSLIVTVHINTERPLDGVNGAVTRSYIGLAEYPVAYWATRYWRPGIRLYIYN